MNKNNKIIISMLSVIIVLLLALCFVPVNEENYSRTIMIYVVGSNLESDSGIVSADLASIIPNSIDLENNNILLYTGGTEKWHNFISNEENAIYVLRSSGFEKLESYEKLDMGDSNTLSSFLNYGYENYKTDLYDLILYNHGGAIDGAIYDDFTEDNLSLTDFENALNDSYFNESNKLDVVLFRTCLNGTIEVANTFKDYANYLVASEEITYGASYSSVLNFLNNLESTDDGIEYGKKFISSYKKQIEQIDPSGFKVDPMYAIIDLNNIDDLNQELNSYFSSLDLNSNYANIVKLRAGLFQYGYTFSGSSKEYDTVDLYTLVEGLSSYSSYDSKKVLDTIKDTIVYNWSEVEGSNGLSIYFPYNGSEQVQNYFLEEYENIDFNNSYSDFINEFSSLSSSKKTSSFSTLGLKKSTSNVSKTECDLTLSDEQMKDYASSSYWIFTKDNMREGDYYSIVYNSDNVTIENNTLKSNIQNNLIRVIDNNDKYYLGINDYGIGDKRTINTLAILSTISPPLSISNGRVYFDFKNNVPYIDTIIEGTSNSTKESGAILNLTDYDVIDFHFTSYRIETDNDGYATGNIYNDGISKVIEVNTNNLNFEKADLNSDETFYCLYKIKDIYGNKYYSKFMELK